MRIEKHKSRSRLISFCQGWVIVFVMEFDLDTCPTNQSIQSHQIQTRLLLSFSQTCFDQSKNSCDNYIN